MSGRNQKEECRKEGLSFAIDFLDKHNGDVEALREEAKKRGAYNIPLALNKSDADDFSNKVKSAVLDSVLVLSLLVLHDEFDFGTKRLDRFKARFNEKADCFNKGYSSWDETLGILKNECGMELELNFVGGDPTAKKGGTDE